MKGWSSSVDLAKKRRKQRPKECVTRSLLAVLSDYHLCLRDHHNKLLLSISFKNISKKVLSKKTKERKWWTGMVSLYHSRVIRQISHLKSSLSTTKGCYRVVMAIFGFKIAQSLRIALAVSIIAPVKWKSRLKSKLRKVRASVRKEMGAQKVLNKTTIRGTSPSLVNNFTLNRLQMCYETCLSATRSALDLQV